MEDGLLSLKWNNHKSTFFHILSSLRKKETYTDATLACEGKFFPVHKLVMSTCSDYFSEVFERTNCKSPVVILKDIKHHDLEALLDYMYLGEVDVKQSELAGLIKAAECLRIKGLAVPDEDPTLSQRKAPHVPEHRSSPSAKRLRRESNSGSDLSSHHYANKNRKSLSPSRSHSSSTLTSTSVPSQSVNSDALSQVPSHPMLPPSYSDTRHTDPSSNDTQKHTDQSSLVPVDMIKVEVEDEGNNNNSQLRRSQEGPPDLRGGRDESRSEGGEDGIEGHRDKEALSNNFSEYSSHPGEIEKEEHDQLDSFNGSDQLPGPSGVQGGSQIMNWGEEEGNFPHNLFGGDDSSHQQVCIAIMEPEMLAVRMFQGPKPQYPSNYSQLQLIGDRSNIQLATVGQPLESHILHSSSVQQRNSEQTQVVLYQPNMMQADYHMQRQKPPLLNQAEVAHPANVDPGSLTSSNISTSTSLCPQIISYSSSEHAIHSLPLEKEVLTNKNVSKPRKLSTPQSSNMRQKTSVQRKRKPQNQSRRQRKIEPVMQVQQCSPMENQIPPIHTHEQPQFQVQYSMPNIQQEHVTVKEKDTCSVEDSLEVEGQNATSSKYICLQNFTDHSDNKSQHEDLPQSQLSPFETKTEIASSPPAIVDTSPNILPQDLSSRQHRLHFCHFCNYHSKSKVDLNKHIRIHTREKPYKCTLCKYETGDKSNYKRHISTVHKIRDSSSIVGGGPSHSFISPSGAHSVPSPDSGEGDSNIDDHQLRIHAIEVETAHYSQDTASSASTGTSQDID